MANILGVSRRLGTLVKREMARQRLSSGELALRSAGQFSAGWIRQLTSGRIDRPGRDKLEVLSRILGVELADLLSLSDQLGAVADLRQSYQAARPEWAAELLTEIQAIRELVERRAPMAEGELAQQIATVVLDALARREDARPVAGARRPARSGPKPRTAAPRAAAGR
jgi:transcriptional regulator with XRE-family HTH domain